MLKSRASPPHTGDHELYCKMDDGTYEWKSRYSIPIDQTVELDDLIEQAINEKSIARSMRDHMERETSSHNKIRAKEAARALDLCNASNPKSEAYDPEINDPRAAQDLYACFKDYVSDTSARISDNMAHNVSDGNEISGKRGATWDVQTRRLTYQGKQNHKIEDLGTDTSISKTTSMSTNPHETRELIMIDGHIDDHTH